MAAAPANHLAAIDPHKLFPGNGIFWAILQSDEQRRSGVAGAVHGEVPKKPAESDRENAANSCQKTGIRFCPVTP
jgi:hypothetical protein